MLLNDSYNHKEVNRKINEAVGKSYNLIERIKMKGNGSPRLEIVECSDEISKLLSLDNNFNWCYIELRPKGIIIRFRSLLETYAFVIPFWKLVIYKSDSDRFTLYHDDKFIRVKLKTKGDSKFLKRLIDIKSNEQSGEY